MSIIMFTRHRVNVMFKNRSNSTVHKTEGSSGISYAIDLVFVTYEQIPSHICTLNRFGMTV